MAVYVGGDECRVIYVARNGQQLRVSSVWVGDQQVFPPANRQEIHAFTRDTQGFGRTDNGTHFGFTVPVPWWATNMDVVLIGAGEKGRDGTKSFTGGSDGAGGKSGAWKVATTALTSHDTAFVQLPKGNSVSPPPALLYMAGEGEAVIISTEGEGTTANSGSTGGSVTPNSRTEFGSYHVGGAGGPRNSAGRHPGGGGGGGQGSNLLGNPTQGRDGGDGHVWLRFRSDGPIDGGEGFTLYLGTTSGAAYQPLRDWAESIGKTYQTITEITVPVEVIGPSLSFTFYECASLTTIPALDTSQVTEMMYMFYGCSSLTMIPAMDTSQVTEMQSMFAGCSSLATVPAMDTGQVTNVWAMFDGCSSLASVTLPHMGQAFTGGISEYDHTLDMRHTVLDAAAANALMQSLGTPPPGGYLQLPATATGANTSIATAKNWTVTFG